MDNFHAVMQVAAYKVSAQNFEEDTRSRDMPSHIQHWLIKAPIQPYTACICIQNCMQTTMHVFCDWRLITACIFLLFISPNRALQLSTMYRPIGLYILIGLVCQIQ